MRGCRGPGQPVGGGFDGRGCGRHGSHDRADRLLELVRHLVHRVAPLDVGLLLGGDLGRGQLAILDQFSAEHRERVRDRSDFVGTLEARGLGFEIALRQALHAGCNLHQRPRQRPPEQQRGDHGQGNDQPGCAEQDGAPLRKLRLYGGKLVIGGLPHRDQRRPHAIIGLREVGSFLAQGGLAGHEGDEARLIDVDQLVDLGLCGLLNVGLLHFDGELGDAFLQLVAIFLVTAQHEILLMPPHHQHQHCKPRLVELFEATSPPNARRRAACPATPAPR